MRKNSGTDYQNFHFYNFLVIFLNEQLSDRPPLVELILAPNGM